MDDELEDKVFYQTYVSHMKILSKFAVGLTSINSPLAYVWKLCRLYVLRPEVIFCGVVLFIFLIYLQAVDVWGRGLLGRLQATLGRQKANRMKIMAGGGTSDHQFWEETQQQSSAFAILGRRPRMEDRFIIEENINNNTGISFFAVFDGHGGEFAADFAKDILVKNLYHKIIETAAILKGHPAAGGDSGDHLGVDGNTSDYDNSPYLKRKSSRKDESNKENNASAAAVRRKDSFRKTHSSTDDCTTPKQTTPHREQDVFTSKLNSLIRPLGKDNLFNISNNSKDVSKQAPPSFDAKCYIENGKINFGKMITDEVLAADYKLVEAAKKTTNIAGTTALIAIIQGTRLIVANVGDSRGVMCDSRGVAIPLSFDHKPQQVRERKRIHDAGGFIAFRGVWRVAGILATSRALGDYPLKDKNLVIANPDILTFELNDHKPTFLILASDGLWDTFSNEEAVAFIKEHIHEADYGAKSLAMQSYYRGSVDNITVVIIVFRNGVYRITAHAAQPVASASHSSPTSSVAATAASKGSNGNSPLSATSSNKNAPSSK